MGTHRGTFMVSGAMSQPRPAREQALAGLSLGALSELLPAAVVDEALAACGRREQRTRMLPARITVYFLLAMWLFPGQGYHAVLRNLFDQCRSLIRSGVLKVPTASAVAQARVRLGREPLAMLFRRLRGPVASAAAPGMTAFGLEVALMTCAIDGTMLNVPDSEANRKAFGASPYGPLGRGGFPQIRLAVLIACGSRALIDAVWAGRHSSELGLLEKLVRRGSIQPGTLVILDRFYDGYTQVDQLATAKAHVLLRSSGRRRMLRLRDLPDGSYLSVLPTPSQPTRGDRHRARMEGRPCLRRGMRARQAHGRPIRVVEADITIRLDNGHTRTEHYRLLTTLLDPDQAPATAIVRLYAERWEAETAYADLKTVLRGDQQVFRSHTPDGVAQELYALLIVYQLTQHARELVATHTVGQSPEDMDQISFTATLRALVRTLHHPDTPPPSLLLADALAEITSQPRLKRRNRVSPRRTKTVHTGFYKTGTQPGPAAHADYEITITA